MGKSGEAKGKAAPVREIMAQRVFRNAWEGLAKPGNVVFLIIAYCAIHWAIRLALSPVYSVDEAEQMLFSQDFSVGYRFRHPPLITWITWVTQQAFGLNRIAFFAMKYLIMAGGFIAFFFAARTVLKDTRLAAFSVMAFAMTYTMGYYPHLDLMHTVLLAAMLGAGLWALTLVLEHGRWTDYLLYGAITALGILSKYVYGVFPVAVIIAVAMMPAFRVRISPVKAAASLALTLALLAPYAQWAMTYDYSMVELAQTMTRADDPELSLIGGWFQGTGMLLFSLVEFTLPFSLIFAAIFWPYRHMKPRADMSGEELTLADYARLIEIIMIAGAAMLFAAVIFGGATDFKGRWMHQVLMPLPIYLFARVKLADAARAASGLPLNRMQIFAGCALGIALLVGVARVASYEMNASVCKKCWEYQPFKSYAAELKRNGFVEGTIIVDDMYVGGNLRPYFPSSRILIQGYPLEVFPDIDSAGQGQCAIAWLNGDREIPQKLDPLRHAVGLEALPDPHQRLRVRTRVHPDSKRWFTMHYIFMPRGSEGCR